MSKSEIGGLKALASDGSERSSRERALLRLVFIYIYIYILMFIHICVYIRRGPLPLFPYPSLPVHFLLYPLSRTRPPSLLLYPSSSPLTATSLPSTSSSRSHPHASFSLLPLPLSPSPLSPSPVPSLSPPLLLSLSSLSLPPSSRSPLSPTSPPLSSFFRSPLPSLLLPLSLVNAKC